MTAAHWRDDQVFGTTRAPRRHEVLYVRHPHRHPHHLPGAIALLAKNSDREPNEAHEIVLLPAMDHAAGSPCVARTGVHQGALCHS